ncbi:MAG: F0F1 ATP synthase subunit A [Oscillospiraceae bacterium]|jgi:F-type H+-transporting ATPase subunit a|nr:F0F1 ATP synthase subunit A [Oscillospiraceae bacterium]
MVLNIILLAIFLAVAVAGFFWRRVANAHYAADPTKHNKRLRMFALILTVFGAYLAATRVIQIVFGKHESEDMSAFSPWADRLNLFGFDVSATVAWSWVIIAVLVVLALVARLTILRKPSNYPKGAQNAVEAVVEIAMKYAGSNVHGEGEMLGCYIFSVAALLVGCAVLELFGIRTPASDVTFTLGLGIISFVLINVYGIKKKGVAGRLKSLAEPTPIVFPIKVITDFAVPVSLAARLFGNMLGGMIIMDLLYSALGNNAVGIPSVLGLYFNVFHPLLQAFIFVTLSLTFIKEAVE